MEITEGFPYFASEFIYCKPGIFDRISGADELLEAGIVSDFYLFKTAGTAMDGIQNSGDRVAGYSIFAETKAELESKHNAVLKRLQVLDINGRNIMRYDLLPPLYTD